MRGAVFLLVALANTGDRAEEMGLAQPEIVECVLEGFRGYPPVHRWAGLEEEIPMITPEEDLDRTLLVLNGGGIYYFFSSRL